MKVLIIINDAPYGTEKAYNALRMGMQAQQADENTDVEDQPALITHDKQDL